MGFPSSASGFPGKDVRFAKPGPFRPCLSVRARLDRHLMMEQLRKFKRGIRGANPRDVEGAKMTPIAKTIARKKRISMNLSAPFTPSLALFGGGGGVAVCGPDAWSNHQGNCS